MNPSNVLNNPVVKFYGSRMLFAADKKLITDQCSKAYQEGKNARLCGAGESENPYSKEDSEAIWSKYDCWLEGYNSKETF